MSSLGQFAKRQARRLRPAAIRAAQQTVGRIPPSPARLEGQLAINGGKPVRDVRFRPWRRYPAPSLADWILRAGPAMGNIFLSGHEGLPETRAKQFAREWADYCGVRYALLLPHGTDALRFALAAALDHDGLDYGGEVIVPNVSFIATATAALDRRFGIALVDVDPGTLNIDPARVEEAIIPGKTRAIMPVHLFGQPADMAALREIAARHSLALIEDAAQAHGAIHELGLTGSLGDAAGFSFQSSKNLAAGEGGILTTNSSEIFDRANAMHDAGRSGVGRERWVHQSMGWNCRPSEYVAAVLLERMRSFQSQQEQRYKQFLRFREQLQETPCVEPLAFGPGVVRHGIHMATMRYRSEQCGGLEIDDFVQALQAEGLPIERAYVLTMAQQTVLQRVAAKHPDYIRVLETPVADRAVEEILYVGHTVFLGTDSDIDEMTAIIRKVQKYYSPASVPVQADISPSPAETARSGASVVTGATADATIKPQKTVRFGIIGAGVMGRQHASVLQNAVDFTLTGITDARPAIGQAAASEFGTTFYQSPEELISSGDFDGVVIATPHWQHAELATLALKAGLHVACEKPLAVTVSQADSILETASRSTGIFAVVHQTRFEPVYQSIKALLESGELGEIYYCSIVESAWRSDAYYNSAPWRGTWKGEGGGVLLNQAPHVLDRYAWLFGMPETVFARCDTRLHNIEVEDIASAVFRHPGGAHGYVHVNTIESPPVSRTVVSCDRGRVVVERDRMRVTRLSDSLRERTRTDRELMGVVQNQSQEVLAPLVGGIGELLQPFYRNFAAAIRGEVSLVSPGSEGRNAVELANAIILSSHRQSPVSLPVDRAAYDSLIEALAAPPKPLEPDLRSETTKR